MAHLQFNARVSLYRTSIKCIAFSLVTHGYGLHEDQSTRATQVRELVHNDRFIFEAKDSVCSQILLITAGTHLIPQGINAAKPFQHAVIVNTLCEAFFKHKRGSSFAQRNCLYFPSIELGPKAGELVLPVSMVAIVAVAVCNCSSFSCAPYEVTCQVHASLEEKAMGVEFNANTYEDSYNTHITTLEEIEQQNPPAYLRLMSDLYKLIT
jgi:hypothetical protein